MTLDASSASAEVSNHILDTVPESQFDRLIELTARVFDLPMTPISFIGADRQWLSQVGGCSCQSGR